MRLLVPAKSLQMFMERADSKAATRGRGARHRHDSVARAAQCWTRATGRSWLAGD